MQELIKKIFQTLAIGFICGISGYLIGLAII